MPEAVVTALALSSLGLYLSQSAAVRTWLDGISYLTFVLRSFAVDPRVPQIVPQVPVTPAQAVTTVAGFLASVVTAFGVHRALRPNAGALPAGIVAGLVTAVTPAALLAAVRWPDGGGELSSLGELPFIIAVAALILALAIRSGSGPIAPTLGAAPLPASDADERLWRWARWLLPLGGLYALVVLADGLSTISGYDSFSDHIARPARWFISGRLEPGGPDEVVTHYPGNFELLVRWTLVFGSDRFAFLIAYASSVSAVWVVFRIAREIGQGRGAALAAALSAASLQVLAYQSLVVYSDSFTALCLLLATWILLVWIRTGATDHRLTMAFAAALGLALGAKYSAGPPAVVLSLVWLWHASRDASRPGFEQPLLDVRWLLSRCPAYVAGVLPAMLFWYARNVIEQGNPLFPLSVAGLPGIPIAALLAGAPGPRTPWELLSYPWLETGFGLGFETGLGPVLATLVVLAVVATPFIAGRKATATRTAWFVLVSAFIAWLQSGVMVPRYGLFPLLLSFVFVGTLLSRFSGVALRTLGIGTVALSMSAVGFELAGGAAYNLLVHDATPPVPRAIATLPPSTVLSLAGQPASYYAMGPDFRHRVLTPFRAYGPDDVRRSEASYLLVTTAREAEFTRALPLVLVDRFAGANGEGTSLWRLR